MKNVAGGKKYRNKAIGHNAIYVNKKPHTYEITPPILQELNKQKDRGYHIDIGYEDKRE